MPRLPKTLSRAGARGLRLAVAALAVALPALGQAQTCTFNPSQPNTASFGAINPLLSTTYTFSLTLNYKCTGGANASFTITGANDSGPGGYRLRHVTQSAQYMTYSISTVDLPGTKITLNGQLVAASYQNAYTGNYTDTLTVVVLP